MSDKNLPRELFGLLQSADNMAADVLRLLEQLEWIHD